MPSSSISCVISADAAVAASASSVSGSLLRKLLMKPNYGDTTPMTTTFRARTITSRKLTRTSRILLGRRTFFTFFFFSCFAGSAACPGCAEFTLLSLPNAVSLLVHSKMQFVNPSRPTG